MTMARPYRSTFESRALDFSDDMHKQHGSEISSPSGFVHEERSPEDERRGKTSQLGFLRAGTSSRTPGRGRVQAVGP